MKKVLALVLSLALLCSLGLTGAASAEGKPTFTIGMPWLSASTDPTFFSITNIVEEVVKAAGGELIFVESDFTADTLVNNVSELISRGVDGILFMPASDSMLLAVDSMCAEAGVYWGTLFRNINDADVRDAVEASPWYAGRVYEDDVTCAENIVKSLAGMGVSNLGVINIAKGDTSSDLRDQGAAKGAEESGVTILNTTYGVTLTTDMTKTVEGYIAAYPEMDGVLVLGTYCPDATSTILKALGDHNKAGAVKYGRIDCESGMGEYLDQGIFHVCYGCQQQIDPMLAMVVLVNKVMGHPIAEEGPSIIVTPYLPVTSSAEAADYVNYFQDSNIYNADEIASIFIKANNPDVTLDYINGLLENFSIADVKARHTAE